MNVSKAAVERILELAAEGMSPAEISEELYQAEGDAFFADLYDDSDDGISRRYGISSDDRFDIRGEPLLPRLNDAGEPNWF